MLKTRNRPLFRALALTALFTAALLYGCSEESVDILETQDPGGGDENLPDGFVALDRPANPQTTYQAQIPCPLRTVPGGVLHDDVEPGCPLPDCIPAVEVAATKWLSVAEADREIVNNDRIMAIEMEGRVRGIPVRLLVFHEIVNMCWDLDAGPAYSFATYCPIVDVAQHFLVEGFPCDRPKGFSFGVSSGLYNGNLIVYQRGTTGGDEGIYVQMYGGGLNDKCLEIEPVNYDMSWSMFKRLFPNAEVLSRDLGFNFTYDLFDTPYPQFWNSEKLCIEDPTNGTCWTFPVSSTPEQRQNPDPRLRTKTSVYGVVTPGGAKAYQLQVDVDGLRDLYVVNDEIDGLKVVVWVDNKLGSSAAFEPIVDGMALTFSFRGREARALPLFEDEQTNSLWTFDGIAVDGPLEGRRLPHVIGYRAFWFAWAAMFPETQLHEFQ